MAPRDARERGKGEDPLPEDPALRNESGLPVFPGFRDIAARRGLAGELARKRHELGLSQTEVAAIMGTSQSAVARLERGDADVRLSTLERYAAALGHELAFGLRERDGGRSA